MQARTSAKSEAINQGLNQFVGHFTWELLLQDGIAIVLAFVLVWAFGQIDRLHQGLEDGVVIEAKEDRREMLKNQAKVLNVLEEIRDKVKEK